MSKFNKFEWMNFQLENRHLTIPILTFPSVQLMNMPVVELITSEHNQANGMKLIADMCPMSASLSYMDLSVEAEAFGTSTKFFDKDVPTVTNHIIENIDDAVKLQVPQVGLKRDGICIKTIKLAKKSINDRPIFAGVIGPFSLTGRLMNITEAMINCYEEPKMVHLTLEKVSEYLLNYIIELKAAGANGVIMAEPVAGLLSPDFCDEFSSSYIKEICAKVKSDDFIFIYHNCGNVNLLIDSIKTIDADVYHFGNAVDLEEMLEVIPEKIVMGNIDPVRFFKNENIEALKIETLSMLNRLSKYKNFVISSGCDIPSNTKWENIRAYFEVIREFYDFV